MPVRRVDEVWRYQKVVKLPDGGRVRISGTPSLNTKAEAEREERAHIARVLNPAAHKKEAIPFTEFADRWLTKYPPSVGNRPSTIREKESHVRVHLRPNLGTYRLDEIEGEVVDGFFAALRKPGIGEKTIKNIRATLRKILVKAVEWGELDKLPALPKVKAPDSSWDFLTKDESTRLLANLDDDPERKALLLFALHTGARAGEQIAIEWGDIDWHNRLVVFRRSSTRGLVGSTKSGRQRKVPLTGELERALKAVRHLRGKLVFCNPDGSPMKLDQLHERLWTACRRVGLRKIRWHDLRHSFGSQLATANVPVRQIQHWMGHSTIAVTMRYMHLTPGGGREFIGALEADDRAKLVQTGSERVRDSL
jgi:integrase